MRDLYQFFILWDGLISSWGRLQTNITRTNQILNLNLVLI